MGSTFDAGGSSSHTYDEKKAPSFRSVNFNNSSEVEEGIVQADGEGIKRGLKSRHAQMIALGGTIGTGLFVGSGQVLYKGGPGFLLISYCIMTVFVLCVATAVIEIATYLPVKGGTMSYFATRHVSNSLGFAMGWLYWYSLGILVPYEITAAAVVIEYWPSTIHVAVWLTVFIVVIVGLNVLPVKFFGETEFWFASIKVLAICGLLILGVVLFFGGGPQGDALYFTYWKNPGAFNEWIVTGSEGRFVAFITTVVSAAFPFGFAPELLVITAGEMESPRRNLPKAAKTFFLRLLIFYVGGVLVIGIICPSNAAALTGGGKGAGSSPFVVGIANAGIAVLPHIINGVILTSAWSSGNSFLYMSSRSLFSMAVAGNAPRIFTRCTKSGMPYMAVAASCIFVPLTYLNVASSSALVFNWFVNITNTANFISWICCCVVFLRFRNAVNVQGIPVKSLPYTSFLQPYGAYIGIVAFTLCMLLNGMQVFFKGNWSFTTFLTSYVGIPVFIAFYLGHRFTKGRTESWARSGDEVDLLSGIAEIEADEQPAPVATGTLGKMKNTLF